jgi:serine protease Do
MRVSETNDQQNNQQMDATALPKRDARRYRVRCLAIGFAGLLAGSMLLVQAARALPLGRHGGHSSQGYLGVNFRDVSDEQRTALKIKGPRGAEIVLVDHDGPGCRSGLREHDVILQMDGKAIEDEEQLRHMLREAPAGRTVTFVINRDGQQQTISTQLANRDTVGQEAWERHMTVPDPAAESPAHGSSFFGGSASGTDTPHHGFLGVTTLNSSYTGALLEMMGPQLADYFGTQGGLLVRSVDPDSPAAIAGMRAGDVVLRVNAAPVVSSAAWLKTVHDSRGKPLAVVVLRDRKEQILTLTPDAKRRSSVMPHLWPGSKVQSGFTIGMLHRSSATE